MCHHHIMCFSSTLICFLVVTCRGSVINKYHDEMGYPNNENEHRFTNHSAPPDLSNSHHHISTDEQHSQNSHPIQHKYSTNQNIIEDLSQKDTLERLPRSTDIDLNEKSNPGQSSIVKRSKLSADEQPPSPHLFRHNESGHDSFGAKHSDHSHNLDHEHSEHDHSAHDHDHHLPNHSDKACANNHLNHNHNPEEEEWEASSGQIPGKVWLYSSLAVVVISLCGLFSVAVIPIMQKWFYHTLLQFLVGLAVGSLSGDGLLHLMSHAYLDSQARHDHSGVHDHDRLVSIKGMEEKAVWKGLATLSGIFLFFIAERVLGAITAHRKQKKELKLSRHPKHIHPSSREDGANNGSVGEKLAQPKKNSYDHIREKDEKETIQMLPTEPSPSRKSSNQSIHEVGFHGRSSFSLEPDAAVSFRPDSDSSVIVSDHHGHAHGHTHDIPTSVSAVAWMVILGDGLHNFCDGLAIGAAFASGTADGFSTTLAVFCHELPHELGDFAMLLKTGMKVKQALFYNGLSSILCFIGMVIGVCLGNVHSAINWVFAGTAGMFLYIALVDMLPELSTPSGAPGQNSFTTLLVQVLGIVIGISVMLLIALYEHELHQIFKS